MVKVEIDLPQNLITFLEAARKFSGLNVENYLRQSIIWSVLADLDCDTPLIPNSGTVKEKYGLNKLEEKLNE